jgi:hypothetical protein
MLVWSILIPIVVGDICQDFCVELLGHAPCSKGSYCKSNLDCHGLFWTSTERTNICVFSEHGDCSNQYPVLCSETSSQNRNPMHTRTTDPPTISLNLTSCPSNRPYVKLSFLNQAQLMQVHYGVFDTASHDSYAISSVPSLVERSLDPFASINRNIGLSCSHHSMTPSFHYNDPNLLLTHGPARDGSSARVSAKPGSPFARAAQIFALIPSWRLLIGRDSIDQSLTYCSSPLAWYPRRTFSPFWYISGAMSLDYPDQPLRVETHAMMMIDTAAADGVLLSQTMMDHVVSIIESFGPRRVQSSVDLRFENCTEDHLWPFAESIHLHIQPGGPESPLSVSFNLRDYLLFDEAGCRLNWKIALVPGWGDVIVGPEFLAKVVTVFDTRENRVGFCLHGDHRTE